MPAGVNADSAEQYTVAPIAGSGIAVWEVDSGWYWLIQSLTAEVAGLGGDPDFPQTPLVQAIDQDANRLIDAPGSGMQNTELAESTSYYQATPDAGGIYLGAVGSTIPLPTVWLPPAAEITFTIRDQNGGDLGVDVIAAALVVTRAHYTGDVQGSTAQDAPLATPFVA
jgi:hypothetical protein